METYTFEFGHTAKPLKAVLTVIKIKDSSNAGTVLYRLAFKPFLNEVDLNDLRDLMTAIDEKLDEVNGLNDHSNDLAVGDVGSALVKSDSGLINLPKPSKLENLARNMREKLDGKLSPEEKKLADDTFSLIDKLLGRSKGENKKLGK